MLGILGMSVGFIKNAKFKNFDGHTRLKDQNIIRNARLQPSF